MNAVQRASITVLTVIALGFGTFSNAAPVFGPREFRRTNGDPDEFAELFELHGNASSFKLIVANGLADGSHRVSSARIWLNGFQVFGPSDFSMKFGEIRRPVSLLPSNELRVQLCSKPGSFLIISLSAVVGPQGGSVVTQAGARLTVPANAVDHEFAVAVQDSTLASTELVLPSGYSFLGAVSVDLGDVELPTEAHLAIPVSEPITERVIVSRILQFGGLKRLAIVDTASLDGNMLHTNSPPFPGVRVGGTYVFAQMPESLGILGVDVRNRAGAPVRDALVNLVTSSIGQSLTAGLLSQALATQALFVGQADESGFAAVPGLPPDATVLTITTASGPSRLRPLLGVSGPLPTPIELPFLLVDRITDFIQEQISEDPIPDQPPTCPCLTLRTIPHQMPLGQDKFEPGASIQLVVFCGAENVTQSSGFSPVEIVDALINGFEISSTIYVSTHPQIASANEEGLLRAISPGPALQSQASVLISNFKMVLAMASGVPYILPCYSTGAVHPVIVSARLHVTVIGNGSGTVTSAPEGISCPSECSASFDPGVNVSLNAVADPDSDFVGWGGDCSSSGEALTTTIQLDSNKDCTAEFRASEIVPFEIVLNGGVCGDWILHLTEPSGLTVSFNDPENVVVFQNGGVTKVRTPSGSTINRFANALVVQDAIYNPPSPPEAGTYIVNYSFEPLSFPKAVCPACTMSILSVTEYTESGIRTIGGPLCLTGPGTMNAALTVP